MSRSPSRLRAALAGAAAIAFLLSSAPASASSALELVRLARAHEAAQEDDLAARRYTEALGLDPTCEEGYLGLGRLRARRGDLREAERVYNVALAHLPGLRAAQLDRAYVRRALGARSEAIEDLMAGARDDPAALRVLAGWYGEEGQTPAQLAVWRRLLARAEARDDTALLHEARAMVRALLILVGPADPAAQPAGGDQAFRRVVAVLAQKGA
jgi:tetratricopeptide (TPR) repeat protein